MFFNYLCFLLVLTLDAFICIYFYTIDLYIKHVHSKRLLLDPTFNPCFPNFASLDQGRNEFLTTSIYDIAIGWTQTTRWTIQEWNRGVWRHQSISFPQRPSSPILAWSRIPNLVTMSWWKTRFYLEQKTNFFPYHTLQTLDMFYVSLEFAQVLPLENRALLHEWILKYEVRNDVINAMKR